MSSAVPPSPPGPPSGGPVADDPSARRTGFGRALAATALWAGVSLVLLLLLSTPASSEAAGAALGTLGFSALLSAVPTWIVVRRRPGGWPFWQVVLVALGFYLLTRIVLVAGAASSA